MEKYSQDLDIVDPQLRNNNDLVEVLESYEKSWSFGKEWLVDLQKQSQIISLTLQIETLCQRQPNLKKQIDSCDSEVFLILPQLMILICLQNNSESQKLKSLCLNFND